MTAKLAHEMYDVFLSHAHQDSAGAGLLVEALRKRGLRVWFDEREIDSHEGITSSVQAGLAKAKLLVAYYSEAYPTRRACQWELTAAFLAAQARGEDPRCRVLVVNPRRGEDGEALFDHIQPVQLRDALCCIDVRDDEGPGWGTEADRIAEIASDRDEALGQARRAMPRQAGRRLTEALSFVGRLDDLWKVHSALWMSEAVLVTGSAGGEVAQITGLAGIGKSLLAEEYALRYAAAYPGGIMWLRASATGEDETTLMRGARSERTSRDANQGKALLEVEREQARHTQMSAIAIDLGISVEGLSPDEVRAAIADSLAHAEPSLWVVDDLPEGLDLADVNAWLAPHPNAKTLITSRSRVYECGRRVELLGLSVEDGYALLTAKRAPADPDGRAAAQGLVSDLGGHPLALAVAGHRLGAEAGMRSFAEYRDALAERAEDELELADELKPQLPNGHESSIAATLLDSIERLGEPGRDLLRVMSMLAPAPFPKRVIADTFARTDQSSAKQARERCVRAIAEAGALSLTEPAGSDEEQCSVHALVARAVAFEDARSVRLRELRHVLPLSLFYYLSEQFEARADTVDESSEESWAVDLLTHARELSYNALQEPEQGVSGAVMPLLDVVAANDRRKREYRSAASLWELCLAFYDHPELKHDEVTRENLLRIKDDLADVLATLGRTTRARELAEEVVKTRESSLPPDDDRVLTALQTYARTLDKAGSSEVLSRLSKLRARKLGEHAEETLDAQEDLAAESIPEDSLAAGEELQRILELREADPDGDALKTIKTRQNLAVTLFHQGKESRALELFERVLEERLERRGPDHEETVNTMYYVAQLRDWEDLQAAREMLEHVVARRTDFYGPDHEKTVHAIEALDGVGWDVPAGYTVTERDGGAIGYPIGMKPASHSATEAGPGSHRPAAEKVGRNDLCPCGSGEKYKRCHGA